jgi:hypothetical protein
MFHLRTPRSAHMLLGRVKTLSIRRLAATFVLLITLLVPALAAEPSTTIVGGGDTQGQNYTWIVTNGRTAAIVDIEFPQTRAILFHAPPSWAVDLAAHGGDLGVPVCRATAPSAAFGIAAGGSSEFHMQVASSGVRRGLGAVLVRFADGAMERIAGVEVPLPESILERHVGLISLGSVCGVVAFMQVLRSRRRRERPV